ncbi:MAG TPA: amidase [Candidatus Limnocylindrales bacterium]|nr:amidase [Candidatus Limnocylindrales bacterium]
MTVATATELWRLGATELADIIRSGQVSSREVVEAHLRRIAAVNPSVNAVTVTLAEQAIEAATAADRTGAGGRELPPLHGVPFTIKGNIDLAGTPTTNGMQALAHAEPGMDAPQVERLRAAGAIPIGRTNLPDFAIGWHCDSELWGATVNPWDPARTPGGSSGGEAAALATGMTPLGLGNDTGASLRWPAQCCGITALKPTLGRIPHASTIEPRDLPIGNQLMGVEGPMARRVADLRLAFEIMTGPTWRDPWTVPAPVRGAALAWPIRVALVVDPAGHGTVAQVQDGVRKAEAALEDAGYVVEEVEPPDIDVAARAWLDISVPSLRTGWEIWGPLVRAETLRFVKPFFEVAGDQGLAATVQGLITRQAVLRAWGQFQETYPLIVAPICTDIPFEVGKDRTADGVTEIVRAMRVALAVNALGLPAVAVPVGMGDGLPQSVQVIGPRYREDLCLDAAAALEDRLGVLTPIDPRSALGAGEHVP